MQSAPIREMIHGHEVMQMMLSSNCVYTKDSLREAIVSQFGENTRFFTCSADNMTAEDLIVFLERRGKFVEQGSGFTTAADRVCRH